MQLLADNLTVSLSPSAVSLCAPFSTMCLCEITVSHAAYHKSIFLCFWMRTDVSICHFIAAVESGR